VPLESFIAVERNAKIFIQIRIERTVVGCNANYILLLFDVSKRIEVVCRGNSRPRDADVDIYNNCIDVCRTTTNGALPLSVCLSVFVNISSDDAFKLNIFLLIPVKLNKSCQRIAAANDGAKSASLNIIIIIITVLLQYTRKLQATH
jgi:hypothetical protein